ncbi:MAG: glycerol-3-phosphate dehydrogenase/oxidase [Firmicutes bacterium]|nr:glycerol-3-phosphate dehydrogenase/oxidase [Bacillota bacterium]MCL5040052.1 glycerol-3-phosphate dehydrogenase/oxidase [Bacillota bacterium]
MSGPDWRQESWKRIGGPWDLVIVGGGVTGAGLFRLAVGLGLRVLLLEQKDFAWGASSRSGKLIHGGLRYLRQGQVKVTLDAIRGRERLLKEAPSLVHPLGFLLPVYNRWERFIYGTGLWLYDLLAGRKTRRYYGKEDLLLLAPRVAPERLRGGYRYEDAQTDDARLVLRLILEGIAAGGTALSYAQVVGVLKARDGRLAGVAVHCGETGATAEARARVVINAGGVWSDRLRREVGGRPVLRPLRGSHLLFPFWRFPLAQAIGFPHPLDGRSLYVFPWQGATLLGTTDVDHGETIDSEPVISVDEMDYLLTAVQARFPALGLGRSDVLATFAGIRPVVRSGRRDPSCESRDLVVLKESGLISVTGGKLTTFQHLAVKALQAASTELGLRTAGWSKRPIFSSSAPPPEIPLAESEAGQLEAIPGTPYLWAELRHAARHGLVVHLDDLLLRRVRLGLLLPDGGRSHLARIKSLVIPELGWNDQRWEREVERFQRIWEGAYAPSKYSQAG